LLNVDSGKFRGMISTKSVAGDQVPRTKRNLRGSVWSLTERTEWGLDFEEKMVAGGGAQGALNSRERVSKGPGRHKCLLKNEHRLFGDTTSPKLWETKTGTGKKETTIEKWREGRGVK